MKSHCWSDLLKMQSLTLAGRPGPINVRGPLRTRQLCFQPCFPRVLRMRPTRSRIGSVLRTSVTNEDGFPSPTAQFGTGPQHLPASPVNTFAMSAGVVAMSIIPGGYLHIMISRALRAQRTAQT